MLRQIGLIDSQDPDGGGGGGGGGVGPVEPPPPPPPTPPPGPETNPEPLTEGPPPQVQPGPPQSALEGVNASDVTGGVQGSFGQAGTSGFSRRFGTGQGPASWFRNISRGRPEGGRTNPVVQGYRDATTRGGSVIGGAAPPPPMGGEEMAGGGQDAEWQRFMREVTRQRFGR